MLYTGGQPGDLIVRTSVKRHNELRREGLTIHSDVSVLYVDAILGWHFLLQAHLRVVSNVAAAGIVAVSKHA